MATYFIQNTNSVEDIEQMNNVIDKVNQANTTATSNIGQLTDLNNKAQELSNDIQQVLPINTELKENIKIGQPLVQEAIEKNTELQASLVEAKKFIDGLDGSQNIPGIRMELTELQNGLKSNQALAYSESSISANDTLEGRTEGMKIKGRTLQNLSNGVFAYRKPAMKSNTEVGRTYTVIINRISTNKQINGQFIKSDGSSFNDFILFHLNSPNTGIVKTKFTAIDDSVNIAIYQAEDNTGELTFNNCIILEGDWTNKEIPNYFEGIKSFGEVEQEGDKYRISILSHNENLFNNNSNYESLRNGTSKKTETGIEVYNSAPISWSCIVFKVNVPKNKNLYINYSTESSTGDPFVVIRNLKDKDLYTFGANGGLFNTRENNEIKILFHCTKEINKQTSVTYNNIMISEENIKDYIKYKEDKKDILISAPLRGFDFGEDIVFEKEGKVKITRNIDTYTFTGDETMRDTTDQDEKSGTGKYKIFALTVDKTIDINKNINNNFPKKQFSVAFQKVDSEGLAITQYGVYIKILKSKLSTQDAEGLKAWLKANQTVIYFSRATPVTETVENCVDIDLDTYQEKTYFNILNSLPGTLDFKVPSNIASIVQSNSKAINELYDLINNVVMPGMAEIIDKTVKASINLAK